jgi:hypothetical protein
MHRWIDKYLHKLKRGRTFDLALTTNSQHLFSKWKIYKNKRSITMAIYFQSRASWKDNIKNKRLFYPCSHGENNHQKLGDVKPTFMHRWIDKYLHKLKRGRTFDLALTTNSQHLFSKWWAYKWINFTSIVVLHMPIIKFVSYFDFFTN